MQELCRNAAIPDEKMYANVTSEAKSPRTRACGSTSAYLKINRIKRSGVLLGTEVALIIEPFLAAATLVVIAIGRGIGRAGDRHR